MQLRSTIKIKPLLVISILAFTTIILSLILYFNTGLIFGIKFGGKPEYQFRITPYNKYEKNTAIISLEKDDIKTEEFIKNIIMKEKTNSIIG
jgi:hypothetical protein